MRRCVAVALSLVLVALLSGCVTKKIKKALEEDHKASLTVSGDDAVLSALHVGLGGFKDVKATYETVEKGVQIVDEKDNVAEAELFVHGFPVEAPDDALDAGTARKSCEMCGYQGRLGPV